MRIYLAGPMSGIPFFNHPAFDAAAARLRAEGHYVFNPAEHDRASFGTDMANAAGSEAQAEVLGFSRRDALKADLSWICDQAEGIALLPGWKNSTGACAEHALALALGLQVHEIEAEAVAA